MSDEVKDEEDNPIEEAPPTGGGGVGRTLVLAFVGATVVLETAMFFFMVPSADEVSALAEQRLIESIQEGEAEAEELATEENTVEEFNLGMFGETFSPHDTERNYRVELELFGLIRRRDEEPMKNEMTSKEGRIRNAIRLKIRNSSLEELEENNHGLLERQILTQCNHLLDEDRLLGIGFKSYQLIPQ